MAQLAISLAFAVVFGLLGLLIAFPVMWLWNYVCPVVFGLPTLHYWQAFSLMLLCKLLAPTAISRGR